MSWESRFVVRKLPFRAPACPDRRGDGGAIRAGSTADGRCGLPALLVAQEADEDIERMGADELREHGERGNAQ